jgi:hypothetical protein
MGRNKQRARVSKRKINLNFSPIYNLPIPTSSPVVPSLPDEIIGSILLFSIEVVASDSKHYFVSSLLCISKGIYKILQQLRPVIEKLFNLDQLFIQTKESAEFIKEEAPWCPIWKSDGAIWTEEGKWNDGMYCKRVGEYSSISYNEVAQKFQELNTDLEPVLELRLCDLVSSHKSVGNYSFFIQKADFIQAAG